MDLSDFLGKQTNNRRILVVSDVARGQALLRKYERETGKMVRNVLCWTLEQLAKQICVYVWAQDGFTKKYEIIDDTSAMILFHRVILTNLDKLRYFKNASMIDLTTAREIFSKAMLVRGNKWNGKETAKENLRIDDLKLLIEEYEKQLSVDAVKKCSLLDKVALYEYAMKEMQGWSDCKRTLNEIFAAEIAYLFEDTELLSGVQLDFLAAVQNGADNRVDLYDVEPSPELLKNKGIEFKFYKGYGSFNEINYVANDILENGYSLGECEVLFSSPQQVDAINSSLKGNDINISFASKYSAKDNRYIDLVNRILNWARSDYSEKGLELIFSSPVLKLQSDDDENDYNPVGGYGYFDYVLKARNRREGSFVLGWGYDRNKDFIKYEKHLPPEERSDKIISFHESLISIFSPRIGGDKIKKYYAIAVFNAILYLIRDNTVRGKEYAVSIDALNKISEALMFEQRECGLEETLDLIDGLLNDISVSDEPDSGAVMVKSYNRWSVLERPYIYFTGLALKDLQGSSTESSVLFDDEMEAYLLKGYIPTVRNRAAIKDKNLYRTLCTMDHGKIVFGYSSYDTVNFCENNASEFYRILREAFTSANNMGVDEFVYGNPDSNVIFPLTGGINTKQSFCIRPNSSSSQFEVLLDCPKKYAYSKELWIDEDSFSEKNFGQWLDAKETGSFFHEIAEKYAKAKLIKPASEQYEDKADLMLIDSIVGEVRDEYIKKIPAAFDKLVESEVARLADAAKKYFGNLHSELKKDKWRVLMAEQYFDGAQYTVTGFDGAAETFEFNGIIDRIDYSIDHDTQSVKLRIIDYKTGKKRNKETNNKHGKIIQHLVYYEALMNTGMTIDSDGNLCFLLDVVMEKIADLESNSGISSYTPVFDAFEYIFPMDNDIKKMRIEESEISGLNEARLRLILTVLRKKQVYPDHLDLYEFALEYRNRNYYDATQVYQQMIKTKKNGDAYLNPEEYSGCRYCDYQDLCEKRKAGEI